MHGERSIDPEQHRRPDQARPDRGYPPPTAERPRPGRQADRGHCVRGHRPDRSGRHTGGRHVARGGPRDRHRGPVDLRPLPRPGSDRDGRRHAGLRRADGGDHSRRGVGRPGPGQPAGRRVRGVRGIRAGAPGTLRRAVLRAAYRDRRLLQAGPDRPGWPAGSRVRGGIVRAAGDVYRGLRPGRSLGEHRHHGGRHGGMGGDARDQHAALHTAALPLARSRAVRRPVRPLAGPGAGLRSLPVRAGPHYSELVTQRYHLITFRCVSHGGAEALIHVPPGPGLGSKGARVTHEDSTALGEWPRPAGAAGGRATAGSATAHSAVPAQGAAAGSAAGSGGAVTGSDEHYALRATEQRMQREFGQAPIGLVATSLTARRPDAYMAVNDTYCELMGYSRDEFSGAAFLGDVHPEEQSALEAQIQEIVSGRTGRLRAGTRLVRKDGEIVLVRLTGSAIQPPAGDRYLATCVEDTTAAAEARAELRRLERELRHSRRLETLGQLVGGMAHDFNNLLAVIGNYASLVGDEVSAAEATESASRWQPVRRDVEQIEEAADRATRLIRHLLAFARR